METNKPKLSRSGIFSLVLIIIGILFGAFLFLLLFGSSVGRSVTLIFIFPLVFFIGAIIMSLYSLKNIRLYGFRGRRLARLALILAVVLSVVFLLLFYLLSRPAYPLPLWHYITYSDTELMQSPQFDFPISTRYEAVEFARFLSNGKLLEPLPEKFVRLQEYSWWAVVSQSRERWTKNYPGTQGPPYWAVKFSKGPVSEPCNNPYACQVAFYPDGQIVYNLSCSGGWWCG